MRSHIPHWFGASLKFDINLGYMSRNLKKGQKDSMIRITPQKLGLMVEIPPHLPSPHNFSISKKVAAGWGDLKSFQSLKENSCRRELYPLYICFGKES